MLNVNLKHVFKDQTTTIRLISSGAPLKSTLEFIIRSFEKYKPSVQLYGAIKLFDPIKKKLGEPISLSLPNSYIEAFQSNDVGLYEGSCGTAAFLKKEFLVSDIQQSSLGRKYQEVTLAAGLKACLSLPILSSKQELLGTFAVYCNKIGKPDQDILETLEIYKNLATIAIESSKAAKKKSIEQLMHSVEVENRLKAKIAKNEDVLFQLNKALEEEQFEVYYQPYFTLDNKCEGVEALIRWNHPHSGVLAPAAFLDVAEETGFILEMEKWVLQQAIDDVKTLDKKGFQNLTLSVNISAQQLDNPEFPTLIADVLAQSSFIPEKLTLEVTERFLIKKDTIHTLNEIRQLGVQISIDDFGTSYSSLQYLKDMPIDEIKIDRSFIHNIEQEFSNQKIVEMIIILGHQLNLRIVAEGVETHSQFHLLQEMNCDSVQGYLFSKPITLEQFQQKYIETLNEKVI